MHVNAYHSIMANTIEGVKKVAAKLIGVSYETYMLHITAGDKWCTGCKAWHPVIAFQKDLSRGDGLSAVCTDKRRELNKQRYTPRPRPPRGRRYAPARDGDRLQARGRVNHLMRMGILPSPKTTPCSQCGTTQKRREYHHHRGYAAAFHDDVILLCLTCHGSAHTGKGVRRG